MPEIVARRLQEWESVFRRYGHELYCTAVVPEGCLDKARMVVQAFLDLYAFERKWEVLRKYQESADEFIKALNAQWLETPSMDDISSLLSTRHYVILQGPPGTGKSRMAEQVLKDSYGGNGFITQFHTSITYEDSIAGLSPEVAQKNLHFFARPGYLLKAASMVRGEPALLVIDEINRGDLGRVLGEAIYLFEAEEDNQRSVELPHDIDGSRRFAMPTNLHVLATMNTADRTIARMDLAIRRRSRL